MINHVILVGRLTQDPILEDHDDGKKRTVVNLAVQRTYKNTSGKYETDFFRCVLWNGLASSTKDFCHRGDIVGIKGRLQTRSYIDYENITRYMTEVVAERVSFVCTSKNDDGSEEQKIVNC